MKGYYISTDTSKMDVSLIHGLIKDSYWGGYRTLEMTKKTIANSRCFGIFNENDELIGFARLLTDEVVFAYLMDVIIAPVHQGKGLGKMLIKHILDLPEIKAVHTVALKTKDAHSLYESYGFKTVGDSEMWMAMDNAKYD